MIFKTAQVLLHGEWRISADGSGGFILYSCPCWRSTENWAEGVHCLPLCYSSRSPLSHPHSSLSFLKACCCLYENPNMSFEFVQTAVANIKDIWY